jgi:hypothetical protein
MRIACWTATTFIVWSFVLALQDSVAVAQEHAVGSTIRLASAIEPVVQSNPPVATFSPRAPASERDAAAAQVANFDSPPAPPTRANAPAGVRSSVTPAIAGQPRMPAGLYAGAAARATLSQMPSRPEVQPATRLQPERRPGKPFQSVPTQPTISPYLYLNAGSSSTSPMTNYVAFVRPQLEQMETSRQQQREIQQLRSELQKMSSTGGNGPQQAGRTTTAARYMDTAQFYRGMPR